MSIQYFYNFCLKDIDHTDLDGDLLSGIRKSFFLNRERIKDKLTGNSEADPLFYDFLIESERPMKWTVKTSSGTTVQEVMLSDNGKYYIYFYEAQALYKRLLFSKHHTLLKCEYFDTATGVVRHTLEPRKAQNGLCILYTVKTSAQPIALFEEPYVRDDSVRNRLHDDFDHYTVIASTNEGLVRFLSEAQIVEFNALKEKYEYEAVQKREESFVDDTPLLDKIKVNDFNVKRNLSTALDITLAMEFGVHEEFEESPAEYPAVALRVDANENEDVPQVEYEDETILIDGYVSPVQTAPEVAPAEPAAVEETTASPVAAEEPIVEPAPPVDDLQDVDSAETADTAPEPVSETEPPAVIPFNQVEAPQAEEKPVGMPDKQIMADGAVYNYYGDLDANGNRSGYGRTMTDLGRTAYEGHYYNDKRSGVGSYFYKNGALCYAGDWYENVRHGTGVGVSSRDGSIHVGNWKNNKPDGNGVRLTAQGDIKFVCKTLADGTTVLMHYMPDDTVVISKYDKFGMKLGDTTISLKDLPI